jgi:hypothetical protein
MGATWKEHLTILQVGHEGNFGPTQTMFVDAQGFKPEIRYDSNTCGYLWQPKNTYKTGWDKLSKEQKLICPGKKRHLRSSWEFEPPAYSI